MSTRAQILIHTSGLPWQEDDALLYHHCDGYPEHIFEDIKKAFDLGSDWKQGRAQKVASYLCAAHPGSMEPMERVLTNSGEIIFNPDIEYVYIIHVINKAKGGVVWKIRVYKPKRGFGDELTTKDLVVFGPQLILQ